MTADTPTNSSSPTQNQGQPPRNRPQRNRKADAPRSLIRRVVTAQESGLLLVIIILAACLTFLGGSKDRVTVITLGDTGTVQATPFTVTESITETDPQTGARRSTERQRTRYDITVTDSNGRTRTFANSAEPREFMRDGLRSVRVTQSVNKFLDIENLVLVAKDASFIAIMAVGMTAVIILAGIDLSIGSIYGLSALVGALALTALTGPGNDQAVSALVAVPVGLFVAGAVGAACGAANGLMIVGLRVHPFVITLGTLAIYRGVLFVISKGESVGGFPQTYTSGFFKAEILGVYPVPVIFMLAVAAIGWFVLTRTVFGRRVYAIGGNETAARYAGIPVGRVKIAVYAITGFLAGLAAAIYLGYLGGADPNAGFGYELQVIAATVIGGASLMGGRGTAIGAVLGAIIIQLINNGMIVLGIDQNYTQIVMGLAIVIAVVVDQAKSRFLKAH